MEWSEVLLVMLGVAVVVIMVQLVRLMRKNRTLQRLADEANRLRMAADEEQERNRRLKQEMTSNIAHELKTPVSSIIGYLEILLSEKPIDKERRRYFLERCNSQAHRLSDLIQDVSIINKLEESADLFPRVEVDLRKIVDEAISDLSGKAQGAQIEVHNELSDMIVVGNEELLYCIFRNLIENTLSYAGAGAEAVVETYMPYPTHTHNSDETIYLHYYDTGVGVADEFLSRLFDRFARIEKGRSRRSGGTGLGLSIVKHAVLFHGGEIYAKNRSEGGLEYFFSIRR